MFFRPSPHPQGAMWGVLVASRCIFTLIKPVLGHRNTAATKKLDFKNSNLISVGVKTSLRRSYLFERAEPYRFGAELTALKDLASRFLSADGYGYERTRTRFSCVVTCLLLAPHTSGPRDVPRVGL